MVDLEHATDTLLLVAILVLDLALAVSATRRPWTGLIVLLAVLPLNGLVSQVVPGLADLTPTANTALAAWHDAIVAGIAVAALIGWIRQPRRPATLRGGRPGDAWLWRRCTSWSRPFG